MTAFEVPELLTARLRLRRPGVQDVDAYRRFFTDPAASRFNGGPLRPHEAWNRLARDIGHWQLRGHGLWAVEEAETGETIGGCGIVSPDGWPRHELTFWFLPGTQGKGYATEAATAALDWAETIVPWPYVETHMVEANTAANRLAVRLGGELTGRETFPDGKLRNIYRLRKTNAAA